MKIYVVFILILIIRSSGETVFAQSAFPDFLQGTWKIENEESYEHWDKPDSKMLKGFAYTKQNGAFSVSEYLEITSTNDGVVYKATVLNQNDGKDVSFRLTKTDSTYTFENPEHDFPKKIVYQKLTDTEVFVQVSDGKKKGFAYTMRKEVEKMDDKDSTLANPNYDPELATRLGADDYGMKKFILVILKTGTNQTTDKTLINDLFRGHLDNINRLVKEGKLIVAGPMGKNDKTYRGIFILNETTVEAAEGLLNTDPAIREGLLEAETYIWYGSAALQEYLPFSDKIWKDKP